MVLIRTKLFSINLKIQFLPQSDHTLFHSIKIQQSLFGQTAALTCTDLPNFEGVYTMRIGHIQSLELRKTCKRRCGCLRETTLTNIVAAKVSRHITLSSTTGRLMPYREEGTRFRVIRSTLLCHQGFQEYIKDYISCVMSGFILRIFFPLWRCGPTRAMASSFLRFLGHTQRRITFGRTPLDEWSARRKEPYLTTHNTHSRQTYMPPVGFEPTVSARERSQTYALDRAANGTGFILRILFHIHWYSKGKYCIMTSLCNMA